MTALWPARLVLASAAMMAGAACPAMTQCPPETPCAVPIEYTTMMYTMLVSFSNACAKSDPSNAERYSAALSAMFRNDEETIARVKADARFADTLRNTEVSVAKMTPEELHRECVSLLKGSDQPAR